MTEQNALEIVAGIVATLAWPCVVVFAFWLTCQTLDDVLGKR